MKLKAAAAVILLAIAIAAVWLVVAPPFGPGPTQYLTSAVVRTTIAQQVVASGSIRSAATYDLAFGASPVLELVTPASGGSGGPVWLVRTVKVKTGDHVTRGAVLATADTTAATASLQLAKAGLAAAKARLAVDGAGPTAADRAAAYDAIRQAQQQLDLARQTGSVTSQQNTLQVRQAEAALQAARARLTADQAAGPITTTIQADQAAVLAAQQQVDTLTLENQGAASQAAALAQADALKVSQAQAALQAAQAKLVLDLAVNTPAPSNTPAPTTMPDTILADRAAVAQAQQQLDTANLELSNASTGAGQSAQLSALKLSQAQAAVQAAQAKLAGDQTAGPPVATIQADQAAIATAQAQLDSLKLSIKSAATQATGQISSAALSLSIAQNGYASKVVSPSAATIASDKSAVAGAQETLRLAQVTLDGATLRSPVDGIVVAVNVVPGAAAPPGVDVAVADAALQVTATVTETDLPSLKLGQKADVSLTALGVTATGTVLSISPTGSIPGSGGVVTYPIVLALAAPPAGTSSGMSAQVSITTAQAQNVLAVPTIALNGGAGQYTVRVLDTSGTPQDRSVQVGLITATLAEIKASLAVGDLVVTGTVAPLAGTSTSGGGLSGGGLLPAAPNNGGGGG